MLAHRVSRSWLVAAFLIAVSITIACRDKDLAGPSDPETPGGPTLRPLGVVEVTITGVGTPEMRASTGAPGRSRTDGVRPALSPISEGNGSIQLEPLSTGSFTEGRRGIDGFRYMYATFRVRNASSSGTAYTTPRTNLTFIAVKTTGTIGETPVARLNRFDGSAANTSIAALVTPTGAVALDDSLNMESLYPDVIQVYDEATVAGFTPPSGVTNVFPYGFVVRNPSTTNSRTLPAGPAPEQFDGIVTFAFRVPLQASATDDPFSITMMFLAADDSETRVTESLEENDADAEAAARNRAIALGGTVTVLAGGTTTGYPAGSNQICEVRTAGPSGAATSTINAPGPYSRVVVLGVGQTLDPCAHNWITGDATSPALGVPYALNVYARDRYGNTLAQITDTVSFTSPTFIGDLPVPTEFSAGQFSTTLTAQGYITPTLIAAGRRRIGEQIGTLPLVIEGTRRVWTGDVSTDWTNGANWDVGARPGNRDTVVIPPGRPQYPVLVQNEAVSTISVEDNANIHLGPFNLTAHGDVSTTITASSITSSVGVLILSGNNRTVRGTLPRVRISNGRYSLSGNMTTVAPLRIDLSRLLNYSFRIRTVSQ